MTPEAVRQIKAEIMAGQAAARRLAAASSSPAFNVGVLIGLQRAMAIIENAEGE